MCPNHADGIMANSVGPNHTASLGAVRSGSALFANLLYILCSIWQSLEVSSSHNIKINTSHRSRAKPRCFSMCLCTTLPLITDNHMASAVSLTLFQSETGGESISSMYYLQEFTVLSVPDHVSKAFIFI